MTAPVNAPRTPPFKVAGAVMLMILAVVLAAIFYLFRAYDRDKTQLTLIAQRAGLSMDPGSKVTYNGVEIGRVARVEEVERDGVPVAKFTLDVDPRYLGVIPVNVDAQLKATTVFGNKYVAFSSPPNPFPQHVSSRDEIHVSAVTTEFNTVFETVVSISQKVDAVKLNATLTAAAQALEGLGTKFGQSLVSGNDILADLNPRQAQVRYDAQKLADLADVYTSGAPDLFDALGDAVITARTLNDQRTNLDEALIASVGIGNTGADIFERGGPYLVRGTADLIPTSQLLDKYSPELFCMIHHYYLVAPKVAKILGNNGYSLRSAGTVTAAGNPWVYPDNLPRVNAHGGPEGRPGCWQTITHDLWPAPYLVIDTGSSIAPYNHFGLGQPLAMEFVWGHQLGENTINP